VRRFRQIGAVLASLALVHGLGGCMRQYQGYIKTESGERVKVYQGGSLFGPIGAPFYYEGFEKTYIEDERRIIKGKMP